MNLFTKINEFKEKLTGPPKEKIRSQAFAEASNIVEYFMDQVGWDSITGSAIGQAKRTSKSVNNAVARNLKKYDEDGYVKRGVNLHTDFTFGRGIDVPKCKSNEIQERVINPLWWSAVNQRNLFSFMAQQRRHKETQIGGELNLMVKINKDTFELKLYPITPQDILEVIPDPDDKTRAAFFLLNHTDRQWNFERNEWDQNVSKERILHRAMRYKLLEASPAELERGLVYHVGLNEFFDLMRGQSDVHTVYDSAESARDMADDGSALSHANAETAYKTEILKGGKTVKDAYLNYIKTKTDGTNPTAAPASDWVQNGAVNRDWMQARDTGAMHREKDMRALKLYIYAGLGFGEHYMGDPSSGNLATATAMELPVLKMIQAEQKFWASIYTDLCDFAIDVAVMGGKIAGVLVDADELEVKTVENRSFTISFPPITQQLTSEQMTALVAGVTNRLIPESMAARLAMELFEVDDIDEALEELFDDSEVNAAVEKLKAQMADQTGTPDPNMSPEAQAAHAAATNTGGALPPGLEPYPVASDGGGNGNGGA